MAGKKEAKQKAGPSGQKEKNREETGSSTGTKSIPEEIGRRSAQDVQKREAQKDLKGQGEPKKLSMTKKEASKKSGDDGQATQEEPRGWGVAAPD
jgi:hypothetical protein